MTDDTIGLDDLILSLREEAATSLADECPDSADRLVAAAVRLERLKAMDEAPPRTPEPLTWTREVPTEPGWYHYEYVGDFGVDVHGIDYLRFDQDGCYLMHLGNVIAIKRWAGPIPEPEVKAVVVKRS